MRNVRSKEQRNAGIITITAWVLLSQFATAGGRDRDSQSATQLMKVPSEARLRTNPYEGNQEAHRAGRKLFQRHCSVCHGKDAIGGIDAPALRSSAVQNAAPGTLFWFLKNGDLKKGMPSWARLPEQQLWQIVTYLGWKAQPAIITTKTPRH